MTNLIGQTILDQFRVDAFVASGGMGAVYRVWDLKRNVPLAMKVLQADLVDDPSAFKYFQREARALQNLTHPNIVPFYGIYQSGDTSFILEQFIDGPSLRDILRKQSGGLSAADALVYMKALCSALGYAHANGVIHCDIKPANVMVDSGGQIFLADFGIARHSQSSTTSSGGAGTPAYMAPEQILRNPITPATDIYALGVLLFEMLLGQRPFSGDETEALGKGDNVGERITYAHVNLQPPNPSNLNPAIPASISTLILKSLSKQPYDRPVNAQTFFLDACQSFNINPEAVQSRIAVPASLASAWQFKPSDEHIKDDTLRREDPREPAQPFDQNESTKIKANQPRPGLVMTGIGVLILAVVIFIFSGLLNGAKPNANGGLIDETTTVMPSATFITLSTLTPSATPAATETVLAYPVEITDDMGVTMRLVPAGEFTMGSDKGDPNEQPVHKVYLDAFYIDLYEVTNSLYKECVAADVCELPRPDSVLNSFYGNPDYSDFPVVDMDWHKAITYCQWRGGSLPTEAQWEKAARGADERTYPWGEQIDCKKTNYNSCVGNLTRVGSYKQDISPYGIYDMGGNVLEWVNDWYDPSYYQVSPPSNPLGPESGEGRVLRGGAWSFNEFNVRSANRYVDNGANSIYGFRCARSVP